MSFSWHCKIERKEKLIVSSIIQFDVVLTLIQLSGRRKWMAIGSARMQTRKEGDWRSVKIVNNVMGMCNHQFWCFFLLLCRTWHSLSSFQFARKRKCKIWKLSIKCQVMSCLHNEHHLSPLKLGSTYFIWTFTLEIDWSCLCVEMKWQFGIEVLAFPKLNIQYNWCILSSLAKLMAKSEPKP